MKVLFNLRSSFRKSVMMLSIMTVALSGSFIALSGPATASADSTQDCNANAVIYCGASTASQLVTRYDNGDSVNSASSIQHIYSYFGITSSDVSSMGGDSINGYVTKAGDVYAGNTLVAKSAFTAGRQNIAGSTPETDNGTSFYVRTPSVSFENNTLSAYVVLNSSGQFQYAILSSCGNPVKATNVIPPPATHPNYTINKEVAKYGSTDYSKSITVAPGAEVSYQVTVDSTGNAPVTNLNVSDALPSGITYKSSTLKEDGTAANSSDFFGSGIKISSLPNGKTPVFSFDATIGQAAKPQACNAENINNVAHMTATNLPPASSTANVSTYCTATPPSAPTCNQLTPSIDTTTKSVTISALTYTTNSATYDYTTLNWGDGSPVVQQTDITGLVHTYTATPSSAITATTYFTEAGQANPVPVTSANCQTTVSFPLTSTPTTPTPPTTLVNTGAGDVFGLFGVASLLGVLGYRFVLTRRLGQN